MYRARPFIDLAAQGDLSFKRHRYADIDQPGPVRGVTLALRGTALER